MEARFCLIWVLLGVSAVCFGIELSVEVGGKRSSLVKVEKDKLIVKNDAGERVAAKDAVWRLEGDVRAEAGLFYWSPVYSIQRYAGPDRKADSTRPFRARVSVTHVSKIDFDGKPTASPFLRDWPAGTGSDGAIVLLWLNAGRAVHVTVLPCPSTAERRHFTLEATFELTAEEATEGQAAVLLWQGGRFVAPKPRFAVPLEEAALRAAIFDDVEAVTAAISGGMSVNAVDYDGGTLLLYAAEAGATRVVDHLLKAGARPNSSNAKKSTPLHWAAEKGRAVVVGQLLNRKAKVDSADQGGRTPLRLAAEFGHVESVRLLLAAKADPNSRSRSEESPLTLAVDNGFADIAGELKKSGGGIDPDMAQNARVLISQARRGHTEMVRWLIENQTDPDYVSGGVTALAVAARNDDPATLRVLLAAGAKAGRKLPADLTALMFAADGNSVSCVELLVAAGANVDFASMDGRTALFFAAKANSAEAVRALLAVKASPEIQDLAGNYPLGVALASGSQQAAEALISAGHGLIMGRPDVPSLLEKVLRHDLTAALRLALTAGWNPAQTQLGEGWPVATVAWHYDAVGCLGILKEAGVDMEDVETRFLAPSKLDAKLRLVAIEPVGDPRGADEEYPAQTVQVRVVIDAAGRVRFPMVVGESDPRLHQPIYESLRNWRFAEPLAGARATAVRLILPLDFAASRPTALSSVEVDELPRPIFQASPRYPRSQHREGSTGQVLLAFIVELDGSTSNIRVVVTTHPDFEVEAVEALEKWRFKPGLLQGRPVRTRIEVPIVFTLN